MSTTSSPQSDPLLEQAMGNKINDGVPLDQGSRPLLQSEPDKDTHETNVFETKMDRAFGAEEHKQEIGGAGVGNHPPSS